MPSGRASTFNGKVTRTIYTDGRHNWTVERLCQARIFLMVSLVRCPTGQED